MSRRQMTEYTCSRCGHTELAREASQEYEWGRLWAAQANGPRWIGSMKFEPERAVDLCPRCMDDLIRWYRPAKATDAHRPDERAGHAE